MLDRMIVDADLCIKLGGSDKYRYLYDILPLVSTKIYTNSILRQRVNSSAGHATGRL